MGEKKEKKSPFGGQEKKMDTGFP